MRRGIQFDESGCDTIACMVHLVVNYTAVLAAATTILSDCTRSVLDGCELRWQYVESLLECDALATELVVG